MSTLTTQELNASKVQCAICGERHLYLPTHLEEAHGITTAEYLAQYPGSPTVSDILLDVEKNSQPSGNRKAATALADLKLNLKGMELDVWHNIPQNQCLDMPDHYRLPRFGKLAEAVQRAVRNLACRRHTWISCMPGAGKDAFVHYFSAALRRPAKCWTIDPGTDLETFMYSKSLRPDGQGNTETYWELGELYLALTEGYLCPVTGKRYPYIILLSDFDRASKVQAEKLRLILDSIKGRVMTPDGRAYPIVPGTVVVATANSQGGGDTTGRCISSRPVDSSLMNRFKRKVLFHLMEWKDEKEIVRSKFPLMIEKCPKSLDIIGDVTKSMRKAIENEDMHCEFSHRDVCNWAEAAEDRLTLQPELGNSKLMSESAFEWIDGLPDEETRIEAKRIVDHSVNDDLL